MKRTCPYCSVGHAFHSKFGSFVRSSDGRRLARYRCHLCTRTFSDATFQRCYRQKKRRLNPRIRDLLVSCVSQRRIALLLRISPTTVARKFQFLAKWARDENRRDFERLSSIQAFQFDDLETFEHTKCKPLSLIMAVDPNCRWIYGSRLAKMPAKGLLAKIARKKYGPRNDERPRQRRDLFKLMATKTTPNPLIQSDESPHYPGSVRRWFPLATHERFKGLRGCIVGQGELKAAKFDPLFSLNHTYAMLRANINRLVRRTWCTTKVPERLADHIELYTHFHNHRLISPHPRILFDSNQM